MDVAIVVSPSFSNTDPQASRFPSLGEGAFLLAVLDDLHARYSLRRTILLTGGIDDKQARRVCERLLALASENSSRSAASGNRDMRASSYPCMARIGPPSDASSNAAAGSSEISPRYRRASCLANSRFGARSE